MLLVLKAGERLYVNGAVLRFNKKTTVELLNDAVFLLEGHVLQASETTTPLRQIYFVLQTMLMEPKSAPATGDLFYSLMTSAQKNFSNLEILGGLDEIGLLVGTDRLFEAMKRVRGLYALETEILEIEAANAAVRAA